jgi:hypothetical protein
MPIPFWDSDERGYDAPLFATNPWDCLQLGGMQIPGIVDTSAASQQLAYNKGKPSGAHGARVTLTGKDPQPADVKVYISTPEQWTRWQEIKPQIYAADRKVAKALDAYSPALASVDVKSVIVVSVSAPAPGRVPGEKVVAFKVIEFSPVKAKGGAPAAATQTPSASLRSEFLPPDAAGFTAASGATVVVTPANALQPKPSTDQGCIDP